MSSRGTSASARVLVVLAWSAVVFTLIALLMLGGMLVAAAAAIATQERLSTWASVGDAFGVLNTILSGMAFAALIVTLWIQFRELAFQRAELRMQRNAIERSGEELRRSADAGLRMLHFELLKMSIDDVRLADVWPRPSASENEDRRRQLLYANLVFQHLSLAMLVARYTDDQVRETLRYLFESEIMRDFWANSADARRRTDAPGTDAWRIGRIGDEVLREFHAGTAGQPS